ncbi:hypothetical protein SISSUDRAFT_1044492 [Sistotremastrum suecicum HHB10207 ss-3]|uniref:BTB domain-containing protein n=1 Tax=Sistotremastrum suecicum HHB10207 ss-3 TaxID=1314776 RepID=A0A166F426_9AGAM|nr:hypothetical protein SISSUDRAFT_1044492 [Sistotremastrum suecicum HHB10207 ss-3]
MAEPTQHSGKDISPSTSVKREEEGADSLGASDPSPPKSGSFHFSDGDLLVYTSDNFEFCVHKLIMSYASGTFRDMISLDQFNISVKAEKDSVHISERSLVLESLLHFVYPMPKPRLTSLDLVGSVLEAARKYHIESVPSMIEAQLMSSELWTKQPLTVYAFGKIYDLPLAAAAALPLCIPLDLTGNVAIMKDKHVAALPSLYFHHLLYCKATRSARALKLIAEVTRGYGWGPCYACRASNCDWVAKFVTECSPRVEKCPTSEAIEEARNEATRKASCRGSVAHAYATCRKEMKQLMDEVDSLPWDYERP